MQEVSEKHLKKERRQSHFHFE